jgi:hypothetical protein
MKATASTSASKRSAMSASAAQTRQATFASSRERVASCVWACRIRASSRREETFSSHRLSTSTSRR